MVLELLSGLGVLELEIRTMMPSHVLRLPALAAALLGLAACVYVPVGPPVGTPPGYAAAPGYDAGAPQEQGYYYAPDYAYPPVVRLGPI